MNIVLFSHPKYLGYISIQRYTKMIAEYMVSKGHAVEIWSPNSFFYDLSDSARFKKWLGYIDQYVIFPLNIFRRMLRQPANALYVLTDNAQGPWLHIVKNKNNVIHCHDFLAQKSALGEIKENQISWTGKLYQKMIYTGYSKGKNFISISQKTRQDLHRMLGYNPIISDVVYNSISNSFTPVNIDLAKKKLEKSFQINLKQGYILHVGGDQWYKNRVGVIEIYNAWRSEYEFDIPLILIGEYPTGKVLDLYSNCMYKKNIHIYSKIDDLNLNLFYSGATVFLFPSLAEGFGWPIAEAMTCGCPVITTDEIPMTEVAGDAAFLIPRRPIEKKLAIQWAVNSSHVLDQVINISLGQRKKIIENGFEQVKKFDKKIVLSEIENIYSRVINNSK